MFVFSAGQVLFEEGDESHCLFFLKEGFVDIYRVREGTEVNLTRIGPGEVIGTLTVFSGEPRTASARAYSEVKGVVIPVESVEHSFKAVPTWIQAIVKDAVARLKMVDQRYVESKLQEKRLLEKVGTTFHHASALASFLAHLAKLTNVTFEENSVFPLNGFCAKAESVLLVRAEFLDSVFECFVRGGLVKEIKAGNLGRCLMQPKISAIEDFAVFSLHVAKHGQTKFASTKFYPWMSALVRSHRKNANKEMWTIPELAEALQKEMGRSLHEDLLVELLALGVLRSVPTQGESKVTFSPVQVQRRVIFESICRDLKKISLDSA